MAQFNIDRQLAQDPAGTLHAGVEIAQRELSDLQRIPLAL